MKGADPLIVYYHSVAPQASSDWMLGFLTMELAMFEVQVQHILEKKWTTVFLHDWWRIRNGSDAMNRDAICLTFDDGLLDNWVYVFPVLKKHGLKMTIFVCPELIEATDEVRPNLEDVWKGTCSATDLAGPGQLSWGELRAMHRSGLVDIQSHTMSHAKYIVSGELRGFYYGGFEGFYPIQNTYSLQEKPRYMADPGMRERLPFGTPLFAETSSVIAHRMKINDDFMAEANVLVTQHDLRVSSERSAHEGRVKELVEVYRGRRALALPYGSFSDHIDRVEYEIFASKKIIEKELDKPVEFLCWPHGDNSAATHALAKEAGYLATTVGKAHDQQAAIDRIPRIGTTWPLSPRKVGWKLNYKMARHMGREPYRTIAALNDLKNEVLGKH